MTNHKYLIAASATTIAWAIVFPPVMAAGQTQCPADRLRACNVVWTTPSRDAFGSMPLGNGDVGLNLWIEGDGDLLFYIGKTDAWDENCRLLKLGRIRVTLDPNPFRKGMPFRQELRLEAGEVVIHAGKLRCNAGPERRGKRPRRREARL